MGMGEAHNGGEAPLGFSSDTLDQVQALWDPLMAGELLARVAHFIRIMSQMMEEVGYLTEVLCWDIEKLQRPMTILRPSCNRQKDLNPRRNIVVLAGSAITEGKSPPAQRLCPDHQEEGGVPDKTPCPGRRTSLRRIGPSWRRWKDAQYGAPSNLSTCGRGKNYSMPSA